MASRAGDLEGLSPTHRQQLQSLVHAAAPAPGRTGFCATVRHEARVLPERWSKRDYPDEAADR
jgi:hypothetical protein